MVYASSKDALKKKLVGYAAEHEATSYDDLVYDEIINKVSANKTK